MIVVCLASKRTFVPHPLKFKGHCGGRDGKNVRDREASVKRLKNMTAIATMTAKVLWLSVLGLPKTGPGQLIMGWRRTHWAPPCPAEQLVANEF